MKTIEEAKKSACPMGCSSLPVYMLFELAKARFDDKPITLKLGENLASTQYCNGPDCMMWRKGPRPEPDAVRHATHVWEEPPWDSEKQCYVPPPNRPDNVPPTYEFLWDCADGETWWVEPDSSIEDRQPGYCGLAGRPRG